ncbi:hypothetical protein FY036_13460 [Mesorhizobium microcysteis]|uniref:Uncharacterized protein n=1 Tax=Neoaquamicrobium microcysteis TaxID=2682781 RepID=A0A5D4GUM9_9HYPH|nr:hypothetical protein [Mesorhizobium microcysteis]TYR32087.1 hypothetical protein FY036_13460 [Mesorhizobium microcysteis]
MKPKKVTAESELEERKKAACDMIVERAALMMVQEVNAPFSMILDRLLTYAAAQACVNDGSPHTAAAFRVVADKIEAGLFHSVTGENAGNSARH